MIFDPNSLLPFLSSDGPERVGFVLDTGEIVEVENQCGMPEDGFEVSGADLMKYEDRAVASWHTHPGSDYNANLTTADQQSFLDFPELRHYIVAQDGVRCYVIENDRVIVT